MKKIVTHGFMPITLALPWLNPFAPGPSPAVMPWLVTLACVALALLWAPERFWVRPDVLAGAWLAAALTSSLIGLCQYLGIEQHFTPWMNLAQVGEAYANLRQRNQFASLTSIGAVALLWWFVQAVGKQKKTWQLAGLLAAFVLGLGNAVSSSRTGLLELLLIGALVLWWRLWCHQAVRLMLLMLLSGYALGVLGLPWLAGLDPAHSGILARFQGDGCGSRLVLWRNVLELIAQRPWTGWGWGELDYAHFMHLYDGPRFCDILGNAHNLPLHLAVELGLPAAAVACIVALGLLWQARPWRERDPGRQLAWGVLAILGLHSLLEFPLWYGPFLLAAVSSVGLLWATRPSGAAPQASGQYGRRVWPTLLFLAGVAYVSWDYQRVSQIYLPQEQRRAAYRDDTMEKIRASWLFSSQVRFAELSLTPVDPGSAARVFALAHELLHYSPEARVVEKLVESAVMLGRDEEALLFLARYRAAFPKEYARWAEALGKPRVPAQ